MVQDADNAVELSTKYGHQECCNVAMAPLQYCTAAEELQIVSLCPLGDMETSSSLANNVQANMWQEVEVLARHLSQGIQGDHKGTSAMGACLGTEN
jgi:hypothetical protein